MSSGEEKARLRADNAVLTERVHILEEQLQAVEQRFSLSCIDILTDNENSYLNSKFRTK